MKKVAILCLIMFNLVYAARNPFSFVNTGTVVSEPIQKLEEVPSVTAITNSMWQLESINTGTMILKSTEGQVREISIPT